VKAFPLSPKSGAKTFKKNNLFSLRVAGSLFEKVLRKPSRFFQKAGQKLLKKNNLFSLRVAGSLFEKVL